MSERIKETTLPADFLDGEILYGADINLIITVLRSAVNFNKYDIDKAYMGQMTDYVFVYYDDMLEATEMLDGQYAIVLRGNAGGGAEGSEDTVVLYQYAQDTGAWDYIDDMVGIVEMWQGYKAYEGRMAAAESDIDAIELNIDNIEDGTQPIAYDNTISGMAATTVKTAIDELDSEIDEIKDGATVVAKATGDKDGNAIDTTYLKKSGGTMAGAINMGAQKIMNMADGANVAEAVTKGQLDTGLALKENLANKVQEVVSGGTSDQYVSAAALYAKFLAKVDKAFTIAGLDMQSGSITLSALKTAIGEATTSANGLLSASDKTLIDVLRASYSDDDGNSLVDTIKEVLTAFEGYPETTDLMAYFATKVDKVEGKALSENDLTDELKTQYDDAVTHANKTDGTNPHLTTYANLVDKPTTFEGFGLKNGSVETIEATTSVKTPKVILATGVYIQYNSTDGSIDFVIE